MAGNNITNMLYGGGPVSSGDLPTPMNPNDVANMLYGPAQGPPQPLAPLPSWIPQNVQSYMRATPSYGEGQIQGRQWGGLDQARGTEPSSPLNPQPDDIRRLFFNHIIQRAPPNPIPAGPGVADAIRRGLFTAGDEI